MRRLAGRTWAMVLLLGLALAGCWDSDSGDATDAGTTDGSGGATGSGGTQRPRAGSGGTDDSGDTPTTLAECDRFDPFACDAGDKCALLIQREPGATQYLVQSSCLPVERERPEGAPCSQWSDTYTSPDLALEVRLDPCEQGLFCAPDLVTGGYSCQPACQSGRWIDVGFPRESCAEEAAYCASGLSVMELSDIPLLEWCIPAADCAALGDDSGCGEGLGCVLSLNSRTDAFIAECYPQLPEPVGDYEPCQLLRAAECQPGSHCWARAATPLSDWTGSSDFRCRPLCDPLAAVEGGDEDAGVDTGAGCPAGTECIPLEANGLSVMLLDRPLGQCE